MNSSPILTIFLPASLGIIMLGLGLSLTKADFARIFKMPKPVLVGLLCQALILPFACFGIVIAFGLPAELAVGLMLLAASPGGTSANLFSHLAHGDVALNVTLTAINSVLCIITLPIIVNLSLLYFMGSEGEVGLQFEKVVQVFAIVLIPIALGMTIRHYKKQFAEAMEKPVKILSALFLLLVIIIALVESWEQFVQYFAIVGLAALCFNLVSLGVGYGVPRLLKLDLRQSIAIGMEIGVHNGALAIAIALSPTLLNNGVMAAPAAIYGVIMFITAAAFGYLVNRLHGKRLTGGAAG